MVQVWREASNFFTEPELAALGPARGDPIRAAGPGHPPAAVPLAGRRPAARWTRRGEPPSLTGPGPATGWSWRTTTTASSVTTANRWARCRTWTRTGCSTSARSARACRRRSGWAGPLRPRTGGRGAGPGPGPGALPRLGQQELVAGGPARAAESAGRLSVAGPWRAGSAGPDRDLLRIRARPAPAVPGRPARPPRRGVLRPRLPPRTAAPGVGPDRPARTRRTRSTGRGTGIPERGAGGAADARAPVPDRRPAAPDEESRRR